MLEPRRLILFPRSHTGLNASHCKTHIIARLEQGRFGGMRIQFSCELSATGWVCFLHSVFLNLTFLSASQNSSCPVAKCHHPLVVKLLQFMKHLAAINSYVQRFLGAQSGQSGAGSAARHSHTNMSTKRKLTHFCK